MYQWNDIHGQPYKCYSDCYDILVKYAGNYCNKTNEFFHTEKKQTLTQVTLIQGVLLTQLVMMKHSSTPLDWRSGPQNRSLGEFLLPFTPEKMFAPQNKFPIFKTIT